MQIFKVHRYDIFPLNLNNFDPGPSMDMRQYKRNRSELRRIGLSGLGKTIASKTLAASKPEKVSGYVKSVRHIPKSAGET